VPALFTQVARFQSSLDVEAALAELTIIPGEMPDASIPCHRGQFAPLSERR
jgi:hypothetical protein